MQRKDSYFFGETRVLCTANTGPAAELNEVSLKARRYMQLPFEELLLKPPSFRQEMDD